MNRNCIKNCKIKKGLSMLLAISIISPSIQANVFAENKERHTSKAKLEKNIEKNSSEVIQIKDYNLKKAIAKELRVSPDDDLTKEDLEYITTLAASGKNIKDLDGLQYCINLENLFLGNNQISDVSPLQGLDKIGLLELYNNQISDISTLTGLTNVDSLYLERNQISDISVLTKFPKLQVLSLGHNQISDISALSKLSKLNRIFLDNNQISNLTPLSKLSKLRLLSISSNQISDITPLSGLSVLYNLSLENNQVQDITALKDLTKLDALSLGNNQVSDISPLKGLTELTYLNLENQNITKPVINSNKNIVEIKNNIKNIDGSIIIPKDISNSGAYDENTHLIKWDNIKKDTLEYYRFEKEVNVGKTKANFKGAVVQPIKYTTNVETPNNTGDSTIPKYIHEKIIGENRYETGAMVAEKIKSDKVILVNGSKYMADGLSASSLAGKVGASIIPIKYDSIPKYAKKIVDKASEVYIIGENEAISDNVEDSLKNKHVERIGGKNRYETSMKIAEKIGKYKNAYIVNGAIGEADAMSISPVAARDVSPIILTNGKNSKYDKKDNVKYTVVGGEEVVSKELEDKYAASRIAGENRYKTNEKVINAYYKGKNTRFFCNGETLIDALSASYMARNYGIVLVSEKHNHNLIQYVNTVQVGGMPFEVHFKY